MVELDTADDRDEQPELRAVQRPYSPLRWRLSLHQLGWEFLVRRLDGLAEYRSGYGSAGDAGGRGRSNVRRQAVPHVQRHDWHLEPRHVSVRRRARPEHLRRHDPVTDDTSGVAVGRRPATRFSSLRDDKSIALTVR